MRVWRPVLLGFSMAVLSSAILAGGLLLSLAETGYRIAQPPVPTSTMTHSPLATQFIIPGKPTYTATATCFSTYTPTPTFIPPSACPPPPGWIAIVILPDDTLSGLARIYQVDEETLAHGNCMESGVTTLQPGVVFYVPGMPLLPPSPTPSQTNPSRICGPLPGWILYIVQHGDTLSNLSQRLNVTIYQLQIANCMDSNTAIYVGQSLFVPYLPLAIPPAPLPPPPFPPFPITPTFTHEASPTYTNTYIPIVTLQPTPSSTQTATSTMSFTPSPTFTETPTLTSTPTPTPTLTNTISAPISPPVVMVTINLSDLDPFRIFTQY